MAGNYGWKIGSADREFIDNEGGGDEMPSPDYSERPVPYSQTQGYYWCDWQGDVPAGAIKAGVDKDGGNVYVGRAFHQGELVPAKVVPNQSVAFVAWGGEEHTKHEFEILCRGSSTVIWQESTGGATPLGAVPVGGTTDGERLFIGRVFHDGTLTPGKIHPSHGVCYIPYAGTELAFPTYEVLILN